MTIALREAVPGRDSALEHSLARVPGVRAAVAPLDPAGSPLSRAGFAYVWPSLDAPPSMGDLASVLQASAPAGRARRVLLLDELPATPSGEIDLDRLPRPDPSREEFGGVEEVPPSDPVEVQVAAAWSEVLGEPSLGRFDSFRDCDGYSLAAAQVASRLAVLLGRDVGVRRIHESHCVWQLAALLSRGHSERTDGSESSASSPPPARWAGPANAAVADHSGIVHDSGHVSGHVSGHDFALSPYQRRIWAGDKLAADGGVYNITVAWQLSGDLQVEALRAAILDLQRAHDALRLRLREVDGEAHQRVLPPDEPDSLWELDVQELHAADATAALAEEARLPFDLDRQGPLRARLLRLGGKKHVLLLTVHHIAADGWSMGRLAKEIAARYRGEVPAPSALSLRALVNDELRREAASEASRAYWRAQLASPPPLALPFDHPAPAQPTLEGDSIRFQLPPALTAAVRAFIQRQGCTAFELFAGALQLLLFRISAQTDVTLGYPVARRDTVERASTLGCLINTLALRTSVQPQDSFSTVLARVRAGLLDATEHPDALLEQLHPAGPSPLFQVMLNLNEHDSPVLALPNLEVQALERRSAGSPYPLTWILSTHGPEVSARLEFDTARFSRKTAQGLATLWLALLESAIAAPACPVQALPWMTPGQREEVLALADGGPATGAQAILAHRAFEAHAEASPAQCALICAGTRLSYGELNRRANVLSHRLLDLGARPGLCVAVAVPRGLPLAIALLAVQKTGAIYLPLDPQLPAARLALMLDSAEVSLAVTDSSLRTSLAALRDMQLLTLEATDPVAPEGAGCGNPVVELPAASPAYCLYTSGSSGAPKGVLVPFGALAHHTAVTSQAYAMSAADVVLQFSSCAFDTSIEQFMVAWSSGATVLMRGDEPWALDELVEHLRRERVTVADIPASYWQLLASQREWPAELGGLRLVIVGGEPIVATQRLPSAPSLRLLNAYGPTETTVTCTTGPIDDSPGCGGPYVSIGRPLPGTRVYVLDERLAPLPVGIVGELFIAGPRLASGYLGNPAFTAERFLPCPFGAPGERMYRSGDLGRLLADGRIEFIGRRDLQVKVRGIRIELGDIESTLLRHPAVRDAVALVLGSGDSAHVAACLAMNEEAGTLDEVEAFVRQELPEGLCPSAWHVRPSFPLTLQGKVDRAALARQIEQAPSAAEALAPEAASPTLSRLLELIAPLAPTQVHDSRRALADFGMHSVMLLRLVAHCRETFGVTLGLRDVLKAGTASRIAALIDDRMAKNASQ
ncbi:amino acid adenylation domain-containing protein [Roseateles sp. DB2]|uniref:non-ribosomal peptide synthetase n=1 Tax=Roseateles sp. DB2 TaxID=3453717 RepID=UPI003EEA0D78